MDILYEKVIINNHKYKGEIQKNEQIIKYHVFSVIDYDGYDETEIEKYICIIIEIQINNNCYKIIQYINHDDFSHYINLSYYLIKSNLDLEKINLYNHEKNKIKSYLEENIKNINFIFNDIINDFYKNYDLPIDFIKKIFYILNPNNDKKKLANYIDDFNISFIFENKINESFNNVIFVNLPIEII